ncbi:MAG: PAS domain S-box protein [Bacteroidota bacterium]
MDSSNNNIFKFSFGGFALGLFIILAALSFDIFSRDLPFTLMGISEVYKANPVFWLVSSSPFLLLFLGYLNGRFIQNSSDKQQAIIEKDKIRTEKVMSFLQELINQKIEANIDLDNEDDLLMQTLLKLQNTIKENKKSESERRKEDEQRHWISEGLAKFGDVLRSDYDSMENLSYKVISNLVKYLNANQGGFFILNEEEQENPKHFELTACYAYDRKKFADKKLEWGEGLIGTCALEKKTIYLTEIPQSYINITSGLGKANPKSILIVPLIVNEELYGVIELASFYEFKQFEIEFVEKVAENIATTISSVKINLKTSMLLKESREQAEALASQEEQMRQNMEELQATQEEATRQSQKFISFTNSVNHTLIRAEYDKDGTLIYANTKFLKKLGYQGNEEVEGKHISMFINPKDRDWFDDIWDNLAKGGRHFEGYMKHMTKQGQDLWTMATYTCVRKEDGSVEKILFLAIDTTDQKKQSLDFEGQIQALNHSVIKVIYSPDGNILESNKKFHEILGYSNEEAKQKTLYDFLDKMDWNFFREKWKEIISGIPFQGQLKMCCRDNEEKWFSVSFSAVNDMYGEVAKIIYIGYDITKQKKMEFETKKQAEKLKNQEEKLRHAGVNLQKQLEKVKQEMAEQFKEIEKIKIRNERTLEGALDAIVTTNEYGLVEFFNKAAEDLWGIPRKNILGRNISTLFSKETIKDDEFVKKYVEPGENKIIGQRKEVKIKKPDGEEVNVLFLLSDATVDGEHTFTAFIQNVEVELF